MEIRDLIYFRAVIDAGGVAAAGALVHRTPGAVSKAVSRLEAEAGRPLFERVGRNLMPTELALRLYARSTGVVEAHGRLESFLDAADPGPPAPLRIASFEPFTTYCLAATVEAGGIEDALHVLDVGVGEIERAVREHEADFGLTYLPVPDPELHFRSLRRIEFGIFGLGRRFSGCAPEALPFAIPVTRLQLQATQPRAVDCWPERVSRRVRYRLTTLESALALARGGHCVVFIPTFIAALHNRATLRSQRLVRLPGPRGLRRVTQTAVLVSRMDERGDPRGRKLGSAVGEVLGTDSG